MNTPESIPFIKMQGVGNDFVLIDNRTEIERDWPSLAVEMCDWRFGVGADGMLLVYASQKADAGMRMFNPDGSEDFCGNGLRCVGRFVSEEKDRRLTIQTLAGVRAVDVQFDSEGVCSVTADMGVPSFRPPDIPVNLQLSEAIDYCLKVEDLAFEATSVSTGTTHTILFVDSLPEDDIFYRISPKIETSALFPERTSIMWAKVESSTLLSLRIWERGAGETWGCGSGASAAAVAAIQKGLTSSPVTIRSQGGDLIVDWRDSERVQMTGPAEYVFRGVFSHYQA